MFRDLINRPHDSVGGCAGLVRIAGQRVGLELPDRWEELEDCFFARIKRGDQRPGDIVHMSSMAGNIHIGVMISRTDMLHSTAKRGVHKLNIDHPWLAGRKLGIYRRVKNSHGDDLISPADFARMIGNAQDDDGQSLAYISLAVLAAVVSYGVGGYLAAAGMAASASFWGSAAAMVTMTAGGMIINNNMGPAEVDRTADDSPTYGWAAGNNTAREGIAIPVIYGTVFTNPNVINQWIEIDSDGDQWSHTLLCNAEGRTNNVPTASDIYVDDQVITTLDDSEYTIETTDGRISQYVLTNHEKLHQMRPINKELSPSTLSNILLHFNGENGSTVIMDDGVGVAEDPGQEGDTTHISTWTCVNTAALSTSHPFVGTANLNIETSGDYVSCDEPLAFAGFRDAWDFECRFRQDSLADSGIIGQSASYTDGYTYRWGIYYHSGNLRYQEVRNNSGVSPTVYVDCTVAVSLTVDTWHHIRVVKTSEYIDYENKSSSTIHFFLDGTYLSSEDFDYVNETGPDVYSDYITSLQYVGRADLHTGGAGADIYYGRCELDEVRMVAYGSLYDLDDFSPPTNEISDDGEQTYYTQAEIDSFYVNVSFPSGLYKVFNASGYDDTGVSYTHRVDFWISYRKVGTSTWYRYYANALANQTTPVYRQWTLTPEDGRGLYEIRIARLTNWYFSTDYTYVNTSMLTHIDEMLHESLTYPHLQLTSVDLKATNRFSGRIPIVKIKNNRTSISVPNYNGVGTRSVVATDNANAAFDAATNKVYGIGMESTRITQEAWEDWSDWVTDTAGGGNQRAEINMVFDEANSFDEALSHIESSGRAKVMFRGNKLTVVIDKPSSSETNLYVPENIVLSTNTVTYLRDSEKSDAVEVTYNDVDHEGRERTAISRADGFYQLTRPAQIARLKLRGVNNKDQAQREAILRQQISDATKLSCKFQTGLEGIIDLPGDVIEHGKGSYIFTGRLTAGSGREETYEGTTVYLDQEINLDSSTYSGNCILQVREMDSQSVSQYTVTGPFDTDTRSVTVSESGTFDIYSPWKIVRSSGDIHQFRISTVRRTSKADVEVTGLQYDSSAYYHADYDSGEVAI